MIAKKIKPNSHYHLLKKKWLRRHKEARQKLHEKHKEALEFLVEKFPAKEKLASSAIGVLMLTSVLPSSTILGAISNNNESVQTQEQTVDIEQNKKQLLTRLKRVVPENARPLNADEEKQISTTLSAYFGMDVKADIDGKRLNRTYGVIGAEQHLVRFPGDTMATHLDPQYRGDKIIYSSGMAPGRGAWGYFANSRSEFDDLAKERERWYIAVQTFAAPNYNNRLSDYRGFFKFRKMLVVNPKTGQAVVCDIADAGPAIWTGKHLGGSPEVMDALGYARGARKGGVLYFFINDAEDKIPLGPIQVSQKVDQGLLYDNSSSLEAGTSAGTVNIADTRGEKQ